MPKYQVTLLCVAFFVAGLALGFVGHDFVAPSEETKFMNQLAKEELERQKQIKENAVANGIIARLQQASLDLSMFRMKNRKEIGENYDLGAALNTLERIREKLGDTYADGRWIFQSNVAGWWIGYKLDGVSDADRQKIASKAGFSNLFKTTDKNDANVYDGGDIVFLYDYVPKTFKW